MSKGGFAARAKRIAAVISTAATVAAVKSIFVGLRFEMERVDLVITSFCKNDVFRQGKQYKTCFRKTRNSYLPSRFSHQVQTE